MSKSQDSTPCLGCWVTHSKHNRLAINSNYHHSKQRNSHADNKLCSNPYYSYTSKDINKSIWPHRRAGYIFTSNISCVKGIEQHLNVCDDGVIKSDGFIKSGMQELLFLSSAKCHNEEFQFGCLLLHPSSFQSGRSILSTVDFVIVLTIMLHTEGAGGQRAEARSLHWVARFLGAFLSHLCGYHRGDPILQPHCKM